MVTRSEVRESALSLYAYAWGSHLFSCKPSQGWHVWSIIWRPKKIPACLHTTSRTGASGRRERQKEWGLYTKSIHLKSTVTRTSFKCSVDSYMNQWTNHEFVSFSRALHFYELYASLVQVRGKLRKKNKTTRSSRTTQIPPSERSIYLSVRASVSQITNPRRANHLVGKDVNEQPVQMYGALLC